jgi:hypothetical protein
MGEARMNRYRRGVWFVAVVALFLLLPACAAPVAKSPVETFSYVNSRLGGTWWYDLVGVSAARAKGATGKDRTMAIVDTGLLPGHEDFDFTNVRQGAAPCASNPTDTTDKRGHGTELAGIAVGKDPGQATRGLAPASGLIPIKIDCGAVSAMWLTQGLDAAIAKGAEIILIALGAYPTDPPDVQAFLTDRVGKNPDKLFVVASMWDGSVYPFPEWTRLPNVLVVAAMTLDGTREVPYNAKLGDLWAPGMEVQTAGIDPSPSANPHYPESMQGTSAASAIAAGCAILVKEMLVKTKPSLTGAELKTALTQAAEVKPDLGSSGRLNCAKAIP